jgi:hypothetical protein
MDLIQINAQASQISFLRVKTKYENTKKTKIFGLKGFNVMSHIPPQPQAPLCVIGKRDVQSHVGSSGVGSIPVLPQRTKHAFYYYYYCSAMSGLMKPAYLSESQASARLFYAKLFTTVRAIQRAKMNPRFRRKPAVKRGQAPHPDLVEDRSSWVYHRHQLWTQRTVRTFGILLVKSRGEIPGRKSLGKIPGIPGGKSPDFPGKIPGRNSEDF